MKRCSNCGIEKDASEFYKDKSKKDGLTSTCKACRKEYEAAYRETHRQEIRDKFKLYKDSHEDQIKAKQKEYREKHKVELSEKNKKYQKLRRTRNKEHLYDYKQPCVKCGEDRPYVIDFHHVDPETKSFNISTVGSRHTDIEISEEVKKCVCLCRNCHQEYHYFYGNKPDKPVETLEEYLGKRIVELLSK